MRDNCRECNQTELTVLMKSMLGLLPSCWSLKAQVDSGSCPELAGVVRNLSLRCPLQLTMVDEDMTTLAESALRIVKGWSRYRRLDDVRRNSGHQ